jgi:23S rRNA (uracil1939-C5)-methyltransferase
MHPWINSVLGQLQGKCPGAHQVAARYGVGTGGWLIQPKLTSPEIGLESGQPFYEDELLGRRFRISASSFFQVSTIQGERLVEVVQDRLHPTGGEVVIDVYAGVGTFAVLLGSQVGRIVAIEESSSAVKDAAVNIMGSGNIEFRQGKAEAVLPQLSGEVDVAIVDPPRLGCHPRAIAALLQLSPRKIIYVSCDPATLARDLRTLCQGGYHLVEVQPVDMFPQTYHVECVATLVREDEFSPQLILASSSPRRRELLFALGLDFEAISPHQDESPAIAGEAPEAVAERLAWAKAVEVSAMAPSQTVVAADTLVIHQGTVLVKPGDAEEAQQMLRRLRGQEHLVITGVAVIGAGRSAKGHVSTKVVMRSYSDDDIAAYIASGEALDKAGAYGVQDPLLAPASHVEGCYQNVVGLPLCSLARMLDEVGFERRSRPLWALPPQCQECPLRDTLTAGSSA